MSDVEIMTKRLKVIEIEAFKSEKIRKICESYLYRTPGSYWSNNFINDRYIKIYEGIERPYYYCTTRHISVDEGFDEAITTYFESAMDYHYIFLIYNNLVNTEYTIERLSKMSVRYDIHMRRTLKGMFVRYLKKNKNINIFKRYPWHG